MRRKAAHAEPALPRPLSESEALAVWRSCHDALILTAEDPAGVVLNPAARSLMSELAPDEPNETTALEVVRHIQSQGLAEQAEKGRERIGYQGFWFDLSVSPVQAGRRLIVLTQASEAVSLKTECDRLTRTNLELNDLFELSEDGLVSVDRNGTLVRMNQAYKKMLGIPDNRFEGQPASKVTEQGYLPRVVTPLVLKEKKKKSIVVSVGEKEILLTGRPVLDENGNILKIVTNIRDLTMLNKLSNELQKYHELANRYETELYHLRARQVESKLIGRSLASLRMMDLAAKASEVDSTVLIQGETGTGKELLVKTIHKLGKCQNGPLIAINCSSIPETLIESELFGYEAGAFTGSSAKGKVGLFEAAHGGTLFLDEISEMPISMQAKLLRAIQDKKIRRIGSNKDSSVDVRIIAASNKDLKTLIETNKFRSDLYYRLNIINIDVPPLRERKEDIPLLINHFLKKFNKKFNRDKTLSAREVSWFMNHDWPGNIRELENAVERCVVLDSVSPFDIPTIPGSPVEEGRVSCLKTYLREKEFAIISEIYKKCNSTRKTAEALNVSQSTIVRKLGSHPGSAPD